MTPRTVVDGLSKPTEIGRSRMRRCRRGLSLVDLLVVIAIIATLVALLLPAVAAQRETARNAQCASRLRQVGLGLQAHHEVYSALPSGHVADMERGYDGKSWGWGALLLPFIEEHGLADQLDPTTRSFDEVASDPERAPYLQSKISLYRCPSDDVDVQSHRLRQIFIQYSVGGAAPPGEGAANGFSGGSVLLAHAFLPPPGGESGEIEYSLGVRIAKANYIASIGSQWKFQWDDWSDADFEGDGLFGRNSEIRFSEVTDGASKTIAVGERSYRNYAAVWAGGNSWLRCGFSDNQMVLGTAFYPINDEPIRLNLDCDGSGSANFSSYHPGGANFLFADGSVRFLSQQIDTTAYQRMARRDDGENVGEF